MKIEEIKDILEKNIEENIKDFKYFHIGDFIEQPNQCGCIERKGKWYIYEIDERNYCTFCGPFNTHGLVGAIEMLLPITVNSNEFEFTEEEFEVYVHNHFHRFEEIDNYISQIQRDV